MRGSINTYISVFNQSVLIFLSDVRAPFHSLHMAFQFSNTIYWKRLSVCFLGMLVREVDHKFVDLLLNSVFVS